MMTDWENLRFLLAVQEAGSATQAARALGVDKATVVRRIGALEHGLGLRLVERRQSGWGLTPVASPLVRAAGAFNLQLAALLAEIAGTEDARARVRLTAPQWFCTQVLMPHLPELRDHADWLDIEITAASRMLNLAEREAEVGLRNRRPDAGHLTIRKAGVLGSAIYGRSGSVDAAISRPEDLAGCPVVGYPDAISYVPGFAWFGHAPGARPPVTRVDDAQALVAAARAGLGLAVLPCILGDRARDLDRVGPWHETEEIWLVTPTDLAQTRAVRLVTRFVASVWKRNALALLGRRAPDRGGATGQD